MNREQKIALILGFAVILVVGVLVSDHWSRARELELADAADGDAGLVHQAIPATLPSPGERSGIGLAGGAAGAASEAPAMSTPNQPGGAEPEDVVMIAQGERDAAPDLDRPTVSPLDLALNTVTVPAQGESEQAGWLEEWSSWLQGGLHGAARLEDSPVERRTSPQPGAPGEGSQPAEVDAPVRHTVARNESLFAIAKRYYGDGNSWRRIAEANPGRVSADGAVREGVTLVIPDARGVGSRTRAPQGEPRGAAPAKKPSEEKSRPTTYTVKKNDSLSEISQRLLGSSKRVGEIIAANRGKISDPDDIRVGMVLTIPARS